MKMRLKANMSRKMVMELSCHRPNSNVNVKWKSLDCLLSVTWNFLVHSSPFYSVLLGGVYRAQLASHVVVHLLTQ